jgi:hypothetical protein
VPDGANSRFAKLQTSPLLVAKDMELALIGDCSSAARLQAVNFSLTGRRLQTSLGT